MDLDQAARAFREFVGVIKKLRTPGSGCPWDLEQNHNTLRPFLIEEAHEVLDAIDRGNDRDFQEELGDLLLQIVLHAQVADDRGAFSITEVIGGIEQKMVRRHPHVFGSTPVGGSAEVVKNWDQIKAAEAAAKGVDPSAAAAMRRLPESLPALQRAQRLGEKAAKAGLDDRTVPATFAQARDQIDKMESLIGVPTADQTEKELVSSAPRAELELAMGNVLFALCQLARLLGVNAEDSLRACNKRFVDNSQR